MVEKKEVFTLVFLSVLLLSVGFTSALTGSLGNSRVVLYPEVNGWFNTIIPRTVVVKNVNDLPINVTLEDGSDVEGLIEVIDKNFILNPGEEKKAAFNVKVKKEGTYNGKVNVYFAPADPLSKDPKVALSATVVVIAAKDQSYTDQEVIDSGTNNTNIKNNESNSSSVLGGISSGSKISPGIMLFAISTIILIVLLIGLLLLMKKKKGTKSGVKKVRINGNKKK